MVLYRIIIVLGLVAAGYGIHFSLTQPSYIPFPESIYLPGPDPLAPLQIAAYIGFIAIAAIALFRAEKHGFIGISLVIGLTFLPGLNENGMIGATGIVSVALIAFAFLKLEEAWKAILAITIGAITGLGFWPLLLLLPAILISIAILTMRWSNQVYRREIRQIDLEYADLDHPNVIPIR